MWFLLDRDGVINHESTNFVRSAAQWQPLPGSIEAIVRLLQAGHHVVVCTNQSGLARGLFNEYDLQHMHAKLADLLAAQQVQLDGIFYCPHHPDDGCDCRKPKPGLLQQASAQFGFTPDEAMMVGDSARDIAAGRAFGCQVALVETGNGQRTLAAARKSADKNFLKNLMVCSSLSVLVDQVLATTK